MKAILIILIFFYTSRVNARTSPDLKVNLTDGALIGRFMTSNSGRTIRAFMNIPFAEPPVGELRFKAPVKNKPWKPEVLKAQKEPKKCTQWEDGEEDCLYLNVYAKEENTNLPKIKLPVMVYFHGGSFWSGHGGVSEYGPDYFLDTDVILVIGNYRLGVLGFLSTEDEHSPGNCGLKDQAALLRWVNENIESFGGDKNSVTIFGESAGGSSVNYHMISPMSQNLFHRAISQSGTLQSFWSDPLPTGLARERAQKLAEKFNCEETLESKGIVECLRNVSADDLIMDSMRLFIDLIPYTAPFLPVMEKLNQTIEEPFISIETFKYNNIAKNIPWMVGINSEEGAMNVAGLYKNNSEPGLNWTETMPNYFGYDHLDENEQDEITSALREFYFDNEEISLERVENITNLFTDTGYFGMFDVLETRFKDNNLDNTFVYLYSHKGAASFSEKLNGTKYLGTSHMDDLLNLFPYYKTEQFYSSTPNDFDKALQKMMPNLWANFARTGNPNLGHVNPLTHSDQFWSSAKQFPLNFMRIGNDNGKSRRLLKVKYDLLPERVEFWRKLKAKYPIIQWKL